LAGKQPVMYPAYIEYQALPDSSQTIQVDIKSALNHEAYRGLFRAIGYHQLVGACR
jgi:hypothetical protein